MAFNQYQKSNRFDTLMFSDPQHLIFAYSPDIKHIRLLELQKHFYSNQKYTQNQYLNSSLQLQNNYNQQEDQNIWTFIPKRCFLLDSQLATIQKQQQGRPISYRKKYKKLFQAQLKTKIFNWYSDNESILIKHELTQQYYYYSQIYNFCFGRKHFVRALNAIQLASDHISRNHCQLVVQRGKGKQQISKYFDTLFGIKSNHNDQYNFNKRRKLSKGNILMFITMQLWQKIYEYIFLTRDKYYLFDNGSRNGSFFIECPPKNNLTKQLSFQYNTYGNKIDINHKLLIRQGFSYEFQGEEYLMKVWRLTSDRMKTTQQDQNKAFVEDFDVKRQFPLYLHNKKTIKNVQQFEQKINWFNNFEKVSKDYIIDESLLKRNLWKGKKVYEDMIRDNFSKGKKRNNRSRDGSNTSLNNEVQQDQNEHTENRPNESYQPFQLLPPNPTSPQNEYITRAQFVRLIYQQYILQQRILKGKQIKSESSTKSEINLIRLRDQKQRRQYHKQQVQQKSQIIQQQQKWIYFTNQHQLNTMVISLDFSNDFKKLYCIITQMNRSRKFHIGSQMVINTARFEFDDHNKCNGYIEFDGRMWNIIALKTKNQSLNNNGRNNNRIHNNIGDNNISDNNQSSQQSQDEQNQSKYKLYGGNNTSNINNKINYNNNNNNNNNKINNNNEKIKRKSINLSKQLSNKIWTKIPSMSQFQLNPFQCNKYIVRLAHAFYFEFKFINFNTQNNHHTQINTYNQ